MQSLETHVQLEVTFLARTQGGRDPLPLLKGYRPHLRVPPDDAMLGVEFVEPESAAPVGTPITVTARLVYEPSASYSKLQPGSNIEILEGAHVVGRGRVIRRGAA